MSNAKQKAFDLDLGVFDPTFPGVTIHYASEEVWTRQEEVARLYASLAIVDLLHSEPGLSPQNVGWDRVHRHLSEKKRGVALSGDEKEELGQEFIARDREHAIAN